MGLLINCQELKIIIFDREFYRLQRQRGRDNFHKHDFLFQDVSSDIEERLHFIAKDFNRALLYAPTYINYPITSVIRADIAENLIANQSLSFDEENMPFASDSFDLIVTNLSLHFINDIPKVLAQYNKLLRKGGVFMATMFAGKTLIELRQTCEKVEAELYNRVSPRIIPFVDIKDGAALLDQANFLNPVADIQRYSIEYSSVYKLIEDLKGMGQVNCLNSRNKLYCGRKFFKQIANEYSQYQSTTFEILTLTGRK